MPVRVLVVDDSAFFRRRLTEILAADPHIDVVGAAGDGRSAVEQVGLLKPDVVTMDIEMPVMDGISAVRRIMESTPTPILMLSSATTDGAKATLAALEAGAVDFLPKQMNDISDNRDVAKRQICARVRLIGARGLSARRTVRPAPETPAQPAPRPRERRRGDYRVVVIGTSTGGPVALQRVLTELPANFALPLVVVQHMPASFTPAFADRLDKLCAITVKEACDGDALRPGVALLAPGGRQLVMEQQRGGVVVRVRESTPAQTYKPCVDITFSSACEVFAGDVLAIVLTGMGADGRDGARLLKQKGATVWAQDEASSVIYGMPAAVVAAGLADRVLALDDVGRSLLSAV